MRNINDDGLALIKTFEGFSPVPYADVAGKMTIGYGHLLCEGETWKKLNEYEAEILLRKDLRKAESAVERLIHIYLNDNQFAALVSFTFNLGGGALQRSALRQKINREEHEYVPKELRRWIFAGGKRCAGLLRRREAEIILYDSNIIINR